MRGHSPDDDAERSRRFERERLLESKRLEEGTARAACVDEHVERRRARSTQGRQFLDPIDLAPEAHTYPEQQAELEERMLQLCIDRSGALRGISKSSIHGGTLGGTRSEAIRRWAVPGKSSGVIRSHQESSGVIRSHQEVGRTWEVIRSHQESSGVIRSHQEGVYLRSAAAAHIERGEDRRVE
jgi:hypothetical protein